MNRKQYIAYRLTWTIVGAWGVLSGIFLVFALAPDPDQYKLGGGTAAYRAARNYDEPLLDRYLSWMESFLSLDLGTTLRGQPIADLLVERTTVTLAYLVPSVVIAVTIGVGVGTYLAMNPDSRLSRIVRSTAYVGFAIPTIVVGVALAFVSQEIFVTRSLSYNIEQAVYSSQNLVALTFPGAVMTVNLLAVQLRYARSEATDILQEDFVRALRANGADTATIAVHVLRNGASSLLSLFFSEIAAVMFVVLVIVEVILGPPGFGLLLYSGIESRDPGIILATTIFPILLVMFGNLVQDVAYSFIDPRIDSEGP